MGILHKYGIIIWLVSVSRLLATNTAPDSFLRSGLLVCHASLLISSLLKPWIHQLYPQCGIYSCRIIFRVRTSPWWLEAIKANGSAQIEGIIYCSGCRTRAGGVIHMGCEPLRETFGILLSKFCTDFSTAPELLELPPLGGERFYQSRISPFATYLGGDSVLRYFRLLSGENVERREAHPPDGQRHISAGEWCCPCGPYVPHFLVAHFLSFSSSAASLGSCQPNRKKTRTPPRVSTNLKGSTAHSPPVGLTPISVASCLTLVDPPTTLPIPIPPARRQSPCLDYPSNLAWPRRDITTGFLHSPPSPRLPGMRLVPQQRIIGLHVSTVVGGPTPSSSPAPISTQDEASVQLAPLAVAPSQVGGAASPGCPHPPSSPIVHPQPVVFFMDEDLGLGGDCDESSAPPSYGATTGEEGDPLQGREGEGVVSLFAHEVRDNTHQRNEGGI